MSSSPRISIVIPCYNGARFLPDAIESCLHQTMADFELIVVDDASPDNCAEIAEEYARRDSRVHVVRREKNGGVSEAFNSGFRAARGQYFTRLAQDDFFEANALEVLAAYLDSRPEIALVYCDYTVMDEAGRITDVTWVPEPNEALVRGNRIGLCVAWRREVYERLGEFNSEFDAAEDYEYWIRVWNQYPIGKCNGIAPLRFRQHGEMGSHRYADRQERSTLKILQEAYPAKVRGIRRFHLRRVAVSKALLSAAWDYHEQGFHGKALNRVFRSFLLWPLPYQAGEVAERWARPKLLVALLLYVSGLDVPAKPRGKKRALKSDLTQLIYANVAKPAPTSMSASPEVSNSPGASASPAVGASPSETFLGMAFLSLQPLVLSAIALPATLLVIRRLGELEYGQWATATTISGTVAVLTNLGLRGTFVRAIAKRPEQARELLGQQLVLRTLLSATAALIGLIACFILHYSHTTIECMAIAGTGLVLLTIVSAGSDLLQGLQRFTTVASINMVTGLVLTGASVAAVLAGGGAVSVALSYLSGPLLAVVVMYVIITRWHFPIRIRWNLREMWSLLTEARFIGLQQFLNPANQNVEALIMPRMLGEAAFGFFSAGSLLASRLTVIPDGIGTVAYPAIAQKHVTGGRAALRSALYFMCLAAVVTILTALAVSAVAGPVSRLLFPGRAATCEQVMRITVWLLPLMGLHCITCYALNAVHADASQAKASLIGTVLSVTLAAFLVWRFGIIGASWSMVARYLIQLLALVPCVIKTAKRLMEPDPSAGRLDQLAESAAVPNTA
jgi:O-antigen/teichoic acid export membrane protein/glycosyltransferase involved in cell wall biosynthesis